MDRSCIPSPSVSYNTVTPRQLFIKRILVFEPCKLCRIVSTFLTKDPPDVNPHTAATDQSFSAANIAAADEHGGIVKFLVFEFEGKRFNQCLKCVPAQT